MGKSSTRETGKGAGKQRRRAVGFLTVAVLIAGLLALSRSLIAQEPAAAEKPRPVYQPAGAPADPKVVAHWNQYHDYSQAADLLQKLATAHPERARLVSLGKSHQGREMWLMTITNGVGDAAADTKPGFWIDGGIHANEIQSVEVVLYTAWYLLEMAPRSTSINKLLDERVFYLLPMMSPDSRDDHFYQPNSTHSPRTGQIPVDDDKDGLVDEDGPDDLDGDGHITQMRVRDKNGRFKPHDDFPDLLIAVKEGEQGEFSLLGAEGLDNDDDGRVNEDGDGSYDPNRDFPWSWQPDYVQSGAYRYPLAIPENRLVADFITAHPNIAGAQSYHNAGGMILRGPGPKTDQYESADLRVYDALGRQGEKMLPGYRYMNVANDLYEVWGGEFDWLHQMRGVFAFTNELFTPFNYFRQAEGGGYFGTNETQHAFEKYLLLGEGYSPWKEVQHPTYGKIEVGGIKKTWQRQPPSFLLEEECHRNMAFTLYHADQMPLVRIQSATARSLDGVEGGLTEITAVLENTRLCPTRSAADVRRKITSPDLATLQGAEWKVVAGLISNDPYFESPREQKRRPEQLRIESIPGHGVLYVRWLATGRGPFTVTLESKKGGRHQLRSPEDSP